MSKSGKKSISVKIYFWSVEENDKIKKGVAWASGTLALESNTEHGIKSDTRVFNSLEELQIKLHELLADNDVTLVNAGRQRYNSQTWKRLSSQRRSMGNIRQYSLSSYALRKLKNASISRTQKKFVLLFPCFCSSIALVLINCFCLLKILIIAG